MYVRSIVGRDDLIEANSKLTGSRSAAQVAGPGLDGVMAQAAGAATGLLADAVSIAVSFACLLAVREGEDPRVVVADPAPRRLRFEVRQGLGFTARDPFLRPTLVFGAMANLFLPGMNSLEVVFLVRTVGATSAIAGVVLAAGSAGGVAGALLARPLARRLGTSRMALISVTLGLAFALLSRSPPTARGCSSSSAASSPSTPVWSPPTSSSPASARPTSPPTCWAG